MQVTSARCPVSCHIASWKWLDRYYIQRYYDVPFVPSSCPRPRHPPARGHKQVFHRRASWRRSCIPAQTPASQVRHDPRTTPSDVHLCWPMAQVALDHGGAKDEGRERGRVGERDRARSQWEAGKGIFRGFPRVHTCSCSSATRLTGRSHSWPVFALSQALCVDTTPA